MSTWTEGEAKKEEAMESSENPAKRTKTDVPLSDVMNPDFLVSDKSDFMKDDPFRFGVFLNIFDTDFLNQVILEIKDNSRVQFKESDLFRVYQSIDLANVQEGMPTVLKLRSVLYSQEFRNMIEKNTGLPPNTLTTQVDCACNCHMTGCHLLCHDDVINTRKISYILYLTEPNWEKTEGGCLEVYDNIADPDQPQSRIPETIPKSFVLPEFNSLAFFEVRPGISFHSVQEVLGDRPRLSLQGWYHAATPPDRIENATLQRLKQETDDKHPYTDIGDFDSEDLSPEDFEYLKDFIQPTYLKADAIEKVIKQFEEQSSVQLRNFLNEAWVLKLSQDSVVEVMKNADPSDPNYYSLGVSKAWETVGPPHKQRFLKFNEDQQDPIGDVLSEIRSDLLQSTPFARYLKKITGLGMPTSHRGCIRRFRKGRDYTVAHYGILTKKPVLDGTLCFVKEDDDAWESGEYGGFECYVAAEDDDAPADEYNQDDDTELLSVSPSNNTLSLVYRDPGTMRFIKYVSASAPSSRFDISMEYEVRDSEEETVEDEA